MSLIMLSIVIKWEVDLHCVYKRILCVCMWVCGKKYFPQHDFIQKIAADKWYMNYSRNYSI